MKRILLSLFLLVAVSATAQETMEFPEVTSLEQLNAYVKEQCELVNADIGVYLLHVESGTEVMLNADEQYQLASVFKIPVLVTLFRQIDLGHYSLDDRLLFSQNMKTYGSGLLQSMKPGLMPTINDLQLLMMAVSDNTATDILFDLVGAETIAEYMKELGLEKTIIDLDTRKLILGYLGLDMDVELTPAELGRVPVMYWGSQERKDRIAKFDGEPHDVSTPREIGTILHKLVKGEIINEEMSNQIITTLRHHTGAALISRYLPFGVGVARKGGSLARDGRWTVLNDSGIVFLPGNAGHLVVCVFANDLKDHSAVFEICVGRITRVALEYFVKQQGNVQ